MSLRSLSRAVLTILVSLAITSTTYLYLYPLFHACAFREPNTSASSSFFTTLAKRTPLPLVSSDQTHLAPFRLLVFGDPQLEGDSSLPAPEDGLRARLAEHWAALTAERDSYRERFDILKASAREVIFEDIPRSLRKTRKRIDLFGNDYYLAHIYRTLHWWSQPTHVAVLGDLIGSQWVTDDEFSWRGWRYWNRVFKGGHRVEDEVTTPQRDLIDVPNARGVDLPTDQWARRIINIAGNHDIGYAGDISPQRLDRFERVFGRVNWNIRFRLPQSEIPSNESLETIVPTLHLVVLNSLSLDTPALTPEIQDQTYEYLNTVIMSSYPVEDRTSFTLLLTHLPLHKIAGVCVDAPHFDFYTDDDAHGKWKNGGLQEQNHLSDHVSRNGILEGLFGMSADRNAAAHGKGRAGLIMTGHDHEGCDVWHHMLAEDDIAKDENAKGGWQAVRWQDANLTASHTGVREVTLRSMMGEFGGNTGLLSAWFDFDAAEWRFELQNCRAGVQHIWWAVHVVDLITLVVGFVYFVSAFGGVGRSTFEVKASQQQQQQQNKEANGSSNGTIEKRPMPPVRRKKTKDPT